MAYEVLMPQLGLTMEEGTVSQWIKHEGDAVKAGDVVVEITTDKLTNEITSEQDGVLLKIVAQEGEDVPVKGLLAYIGQPGEQVGETTAPAVSAASAAPSAEPAAALAAWFADGGMEALVLGCTHFPYFKEALAARTGLPLVDPAEEMLRLLEGKKTDFLPFVSRKGRPYEASLKMDENYRIEMTFRDTPVERQPLPASDPSVMQAADIPVETPRPGQLP